MLFWLDMLPNTASGSVIPSLKILAPLLHDIDTGPSDGGTFYGFVPSLKSDAGTSLYYHVALCGFSNLVEQLIVKHPLHVKAISGYYMTPAVAALAKRHFQLAQILHRNGSALIRGTAGRTRDHSAASCRLFWGSRNGSGITPLHRASTNGKIEVVRLVLIEHCASVEVQDSEGRTPLDLA
ncbi:hypothetical protein V8E52_009917 [Russula decolorans]